MKKLLLLLSLLLAPTLASAQCIGVFDPNTVCGNAGGSPDLPSSVPISSFPILPSGANGNIQYNNGGTFGGLTDYQVATRVQPFLKGINTINQKIFTANGTYFPLTGLVKSLFECVGPAGGGGGAAGTAGQVFAGSGGGAGEYSFHWAMAAEIGSSLPVLIPAGGAGGTGAAAGSDGVGASSMASLINANPGRGGNFGASTATKAVVGGLGGTGGTTDLSTPGSPGSSGFLNTTSQSIQIPSGNGGASRFGGGALGVSAAAGVSNGIAGTGYGSGGSGAFAVNTASTGTGGAGSSGACLATEYAIQDLVPSASQPIVIYRQATNNYLVNAPIVNGLPGEYVTWQFINLGSPQILELWGVSTNENGVIRTQTDGSIAQSVFEFAFNIGRTDNAFPSTYQYAGNFHGNSTGASPSISMDGGANILNMPVGNYVRGTSLTIAQTPTLTLPSIATPNGTPGSTFSNINQGHIITATGITFSLTTTNVQTNAGENNSYFGMLPTTGMDRVQFGANAPFAINTGIANQSPNQGQISTVTTWNTARPDLKLVLQLPNGSPCSPDGWTKVTTSNTFNIDNVAPNFAKIYTNSRSGNTGIASTNSSCLSHYMMTK